MTPPPRRPDDDLPPLPPLPVAEPAGPDPFAETVYAEVVEPLPAEDPADLPVAVPVRPAAPLPPRPAEPVPEPADPPRPRVLAACAVLGCLGLGMLAAVGFLAYGAILILDHLGDRAATPDRPAGVAGAEWARPGPIRPTALADRTATVRLEAPFDAVGRAAGGRYLLFRIPTQNRIVAFDPNTGAMVPGFEVRLAEPNSLFAGGAAKVWLYHPRAKQVERVDLLTGRPEQRAVVDAGAPTAMAVGAGSDGPVYLASGDTFWTDFRVVDGVRLTVTTAVGSGEGVGKGIRVRASDDGSVLAVWGPDGAAVVRPDPAAGRAAFTLLKSDDGAPLKLAAPSPDGRFVYTPRGAYSPDGRLTLRPADGDEFFYTLPAAHGEMYLGLDVSDSGALTGPPKVYPAGARSLLRNLNGVIIPRGFRAADTGDVPPNQRLYYWPGAGLAAVLPPGNKTIELFKTDTPVPRPKGG